MILTRSLKIRGVWLKLLYFIPFLIFIFGLITSWSELYSVSSFGIQYLYVFLIPTIIFAYQGIRNSIIGWVAVMILYTLFLIEWIIGLVQAYSLVGAKTSVRQYITIWVFVLFYLGIGVIYINARPKKKLI